MSSQDGEMNMVGGYRVVRKLGGGERAEVFLGHGGTREPGGQQSVAAIKVYRESTTIDSISTEIEALTRTSAPHLLAVVDLATLPDGRPCLILPRLGSGNLGRLLAARGTIAAGEAVTLLVPVIEAVRQLHRVGVTHGAIGAAAVLFDNRGTPILARFGRSGAMEVARSRGIVQQPTPAQRDAEPGMASDLRALQEFVTSVLRQLDGEAVVDRRLDDIRELVTPSRDRDSSGDSTATWQRLEHVIELLFELAPARAVRFDEQPASTTHAIPVRLPTENPPGAIATATATTGTTGSRGLGGLVAGAHAAIMTAVDENPVRRLQKAVARMIAPVRRPVWIAGAAGLAALFVAVTVIPLLGATDASATAPTIGSRSSAPTALSPTAPASAAPSYSASRPVIPPATPKATTAAAGLVSSAKSDDPVVAADALLTARADCFHRRSSACLATVDQAGSAVLEADLHLIGALRRGTDVPQQNSLAGYLPHLMQRLGDSAILQCDPPTLDGKPASLLIVRNKAGWQVRDIGFG